MSIIATGQISIVDLSDGKASTEELKHVAYEQLINGKSMLEIFEEHGFDPEILGSVSKGKSCSFEWFFRQIKRRICRNSSAISRIWNAELAEKTPKMRFREFRNRP